MKNISKILILLVSVCLFVTSCKKESPLKTSISGTTWWSERTVEHGTCRTEFSFTGSSFSVAMTYPLTPSYPGHRVTGKYTYTYPTIHLECPEFTDNAVMAPDFKSFELGDEVFIRE